MYTTNTRPKSEVRGILPLINPEAEGQGVYQWQNSDDRGMRVVYLLYTPNSHGSYDIYYGEAIPLAYKCCMQCAIYLQQGYIHTYIHGHAIGAGAPKQSLIVPVT